MPTHAFTIAKLADAAGVGVEAVRYYQRGGLLAAPKRVDGGFRQYSDDDVLRLRFIKRARDLGFSMTEIAELVSLWHDKRRASSEVKRIASAHLAELEQRIQAMQAMRHTLQDLLQHCHGDARPDCPILDKLAGAPIPPRPD